MLKRFEYVMDEDIVSWMRTADESDTISTVYVKRNKSTDDTGEVHMSSKFPIKLCFEI